MPLVEFVRKHKESGARGLSGAAGYDGSDQLLAFQLNCGLGIDDGIAGSMKAIDYQTVIDLANRMSVDILHSLIITFNERIFVYVPLVRIGKRFSKTADRFTGRFCQFAVRIDTAEHPKSQQND